MEWLPIAGVATLLGLALLYRWPLEASLGVYAFLLPFDSVLIAGSVGGIHLHANWFVAIAAACLLSAAGLLNRGFLHPPRPSLWLMVFVFWAGISFWWAIEPKSATFRLPVVALLLLFYLAAACVPIGGKELKTIGWLSILGACLAAAISIHQFSQGQYYVPQGKDEPIETVGRATLWLREANTNPNTFSASLILPLALALGKLFSARAWLTRLLTMGAVILIVSSIYLTMSRGTAIASVVVLFICLLRSRGKARWRLLTLMAIIAAIVPLMPDLFFSRISETSEDRGAGRLDVWEVGLLTFKNYALWGAGLDCFPPAFDKNASMALTFRGFNRASHNAYLGAGVELGTIGLILLTVLIRGHLRLAGQARRASNDESSYIELISYEAACWGVLTCGLFGDLLWEEYFWFTLMLLVMGFQSQQVARGQYLRSTDALSLQPLHFANSR